MRGGGGVTNKKWKRRRRRRSRRIEKPAQQSLEQFGKHDNLLLPNPTQSRAITICKNCDSQALMAPIYLIKVEHIFTRVGMNLEAGKLESSSHSAFLSLGKSGMGVSAPDLSSFLTCRYDVEDAGPPLPPQLVPPPAEQRPVVRLVPGHVAHHADRAVDDDVLLGHVAKLVGRVELPAGIKS